jgi:hypothetical protein
MGGSTISDVTTSLMVDNQYVQNISVNAIPGNSGHDVSFIWIPVTEGDHYLVMVADPGNNIQELDETNNEDQLIIHDVAGSSNQDPSPPPNTPPGIIIVHPDNGSTISGIITVKAEIKGCNCTLGSFLYLDGYFIVNGTMDLDEIVYHEGQHYFIWTYHLDTNGYENGNHLMEIRDTHGRFTVAEIEILNEEDPANTPFDQNTSSSDDPKPYKEAMTFDTPASMVALILIMMGVIIGLVVISYRKSKPN